MKVQVDRNKCQSYGNCVDEAPELFDLDDAGISVPLVDEVPDDQRESARNAAASCPANAIRIDE